jgi:quercetin dioxygenase-like cupin family protein
MLVYLDPSKPVDEPVSHVGQEFNYVVEGSVRVTVGRREYTLNVGDSIYFDARLPHKEIANGQPSRFIAIIQDR